MPTLLRCSAQLVSYSTAKKLLEITKKFDRPVDGLLQLNWNTKINITTISPSGVLDNTQCFWWKQFIFKHSISSKAKTRIQSYQDIDIISKNIQKNTINMRLLI